MEPDYNLIGTGIDLREVDPISQRRLLAFFNFWLSQTVKFLNDCASTFETKLLDVDNRLRRLEASMTLLEAKLASVPGLDVDTNAIRPTTVPNAVQENGEVQKENVEPAKAMPTVSNGATEEKNKEPVPQEPMVEVKEDITKDPRYAKYFKMLQLGVPEQAVKQKMELEGIDPSILSQSGAASAAKTARKEEKKVEEDAESMDSFGGSDESSFSD